ncbi:MAG: hypothetical protein ACKOC5_01280 [Chloroflexota bacterium]
MNVRTHLIAGVCIGDTHQGIVVEVQGNGYYAAVRGDDGNKRFVNAAYTTFYPNNQPLYYGERVMYNLIPSGYASAGKVACIAPAE